MNVLNEISMKYDEYIAFLIEKYGQPQYDYFTNEDCKTRNTKGIRTEEGLFQHHIDENIAIKLSSPEFAIKQPFSYQKANRLVYCNFLEHFLLHIKIVEERKDKASVVGIGGAELLWRTLNDTFYRGKASVNWQNICFETVKEHYLDYIILLGYLISIVDADEVLSKEFSHKDFACGWNGHLVKGIYYDLKAIVPNFDKEG